MQITEAQNKAVDSILELIVDATGNNKQINPATAIAAAARLAGSFLFRSFNFKVENASPGSPVLSEEANEKGPMLINILASALNSLGVNLDNNKMSASSNVEPNLTFVDTLNRTQNQAQVIMNENKLSQEEMAHSCTLAAAVFIKECGSVLPVETGFHTAVYGFIEGSKTYPPELESIQ